MNSQQNNYIQTEINNYPDYIRGGDNFDYSNQNKIITNKAKELIKNFKKQHQIDIDNNNNENQKILSTEINQISSSQQKAREELKSYDYYIRGEGKEKNENISPSIQKNNLVNEIPIQNIDMMNQENAKLKKQVMNLIQENNNLKNKVNYNNSNKSFISQNENNISMNINRNNNIPMNDKMFLEKSMESIIKSNIRFGQKNNNNDYYKNINMNNNNNKILYNQRSPNYNYNYNYNGIKPQNYIDNIINMNNMNNNIYNNRSSPNIINDYNQLLNDYRNTKYRLDNLQIELQNNKGLENKYRILNNNYTDVKNRNKELIITIQKLKNDNVALSQHIEELTKQKKRAESKLKNKIKINIENNNVNNINELKALKNRYTELQKNLEDMMKSKKEAANNEYRKRNERNVLLSENKKLKNEINNLQKSETEAQKKIKELNAYIQQLLTEKNNVNDNSTQMIEQYKIKFNEINKEKDNLIKQKNSLINKCDALERKLEELNINQKESNENELLQNKIKEYEEEIETIKNKDKIKSLENIGLINELKNTINNYKSQLQEKQNELDILNQKLNEKYPI